MKSDVNTVTLTGRLTKEPDNRTTPENVHVTDFSIAVNHYTSTGKQYPTYVRVTLWKKAAEVLGQKLGKGDFVLVQGMLVNDDFVTKDGAQTNGRMKIDHANVKILRYADRDVEEVNE